ncbi:MAG: VOC family protein [Thermoplasmatota archaeon]
MPPPFGALAFLYVGTDDMARDLAYYEDVLGATRVWKFEAFGTEVAALRLDADGPLYLLAEHRHAPSVLPIYRVDSLDATTRTLATRGWKAEGPAFEIPNGPCVLFKDPSGNELAIFEDVRPHALTDA